MFGNGKPPPRGSSSSSKEMCEYCHQQPKFQPYDYCSKACGSRAKTSTKGPAMCKQCGQKPVFKGHQFCGKGCASSWQIVNGSSMYPSWYGQPYHGSQRMWGPAPQHRHPQYHHGGQGQGQSHTVTGIIGGFIKSIVSPTPPRPQSPKRRPTLPATPHTHNFSGSTSRDPLMNPLLNPLVISPDPPMFSGMGGRRSPRLSAPTSSGSSSQKFLTPSPSPVSGAQDLNASGQISGSRVSSPPPSPMSQIQIRNSTSGQDPTATDMDISPPTYSAEDVQPEDGLEAFGLGADPDQDPTLPPGDDNDGPISPRSQTQMQVSARLVSPHGGDGRHGSRPLDPYDPSYSPALKYMSGITGPHGKCRLKGCNNPVFVDKYTRHRSDYCSQRHREDAVSSQQVVPCIMCGVMPRSREDHFCSRTCRDAALHS